MDSSIAWYLIFVAVYYCHCYINIQVVLYTCLLNFVIVAEQTCTERQYPPAEIAQILDSAVTSLQPCCPQNLPIYREIETFMGIIKNQMLALIPTPSIIPPVEVPIVQKWIQSVVCTVVCFSYQVLFSCLVCIMMMICSLYQDIQWYSIKACT